MEIIKKRIADMERAEYNPRVELSFYGLMQEELAKKTDYHRKVFGLDE